ncbi:MAG: flagellar brake protein [Bacillota bacterium]
MRFDELNIGLKLELKLYGQESTLNNSVFVSEFEWAQSSKILFVAAPIHEGKLYPVSIGTLVDVSFISGNNLYEFRAKVIDRGVKHNISLLKIEALSDIERIQRREFFRFECAIPVSVRIMNSLKNADFQDTNVIKTFTRDLSGGGVCIRLKEQVEQGKFISCELSLNDFNKVGFVGKVVRLTKYDTSQGIYKYEIGVLFEKIEQKDREKIISFIFQEQRRLIKKG